jgi:hypothetical protein
MNALVGQKVKLPTDCKCGAGADHGRAEPRLIFLHRAHARLLLVENGLMSLDEAVFGLLEDYCPCTRRQG